MHNFTDSDKVISVQAGKRLPIPCHFTHDPLNRITNIEWTKDESQIDIGPGDKIDFGMDGSIIINDVQRRHQGTYRYEVHLFCLTSGVHCTIMRRFPLKVLQIRKLSKAILAGAA